MSSGTEENLVHIDPVDVDSFPKENVPNCEKTCDSGIESTDSCSATLPTSDCEISPVKQYINNISVDLNNDTEKVLDLDSNPSLTSPTSLTPDFNDGTDNLLGFDEFNISKTEDIFNEIDEMLNAKVDVELPETIDNNAIDRIIETATSATGRAHDDLQGFDEFNISKTEDIFNEIDEMLNAKVIVELPEKINNNEMDSIIETATSATGSSHDYLQAKNSENENNKEMLYNLNDYENTNKNRTTSTVSLDEQNLLDTNTVTMIKSPYSRSAENISIINQKSCTNSLNTEQILSQFNNQKSKVIATQKFTPEPPKQIPEPNQIIDARYSRIPKEILSQDLGSIVKNVHGIFSSVSGSLKNAYNHSQRAPKAPIKAVVKTIPNGKVMDDIFEDEPKISLINIQEKQKQAPLEIKEEIPVEKDIENEPRKDILRLQIESLERVLAEQRKENSSLRERVKQQVDELQDKDQTFKELEVKVDQMSKRVEQAEREKDAAVMRYASVECAAIEARRAADKAKEAERAAVAEMELLNNKLKSAHGEKARICQLYDDKCHELSTCERELSKVREDVKELEGRLKWTQSKLRMEMDAYKDSAERVEKLTQQVSELEAAKDTAAANANDSAKARQLEQELKESQAALILCRHEKEDLERRLIATTQLLDSCKRERDSNSSALTLAQAEVERLVESNLHLEQEAAELAALRAQAALADTLSGQLQREMSRAAQAEEALSLERARADTCARREAAALLHSATLTAKHVQQRAADCTHQHKAQALALDNEALRERITYLEAEYERVTTALGDEIERRNKETRALARKVAELTEEAAEANQKLEWEKGENCVLKKKHANAIKELNRELQRALKRCEQLEAKLPPPDASSTTTGSVSSLSSSETPPDEIRLQNGHSDLPDIQVREPDRQALIERIVSLQRAAARRSERCDFLEEHCRQLTAELRGKSRLVRQLLCAMPAGAVTSPHSDAHKKEIARLGGGAMAAVWGGDAGGMTLELSLEMNNRLQAVLEDALLKNITLKENMDTLGEEIARLKQEMNIKSENNLK